VKTSIEKGMVCDICGAEDNLERDDLNNILCPDCKDMPEIKGDFEGICDGCGKPLENLEDHTDEYGNIFCSECQELKEQIDKNLTL
jgi:predicted amidophosphoribosyltransferase